MKTCQYTIDDLNVDLKSIIKEIETVSYSPELVLSINRGGCIPGIYLSHYFKVPHKVINIQLRDGDGNIEVDLNKKYLTNKKRILVVDDINDTGKTFKEIEKITKNNDCDFKFCALLDNIQSRQKIHFRGKSINKSFDPLWYIFPWENWW